jgi:hypothetical protein
VTERGAYANARRAMYWAKSLLTRWCVRLLSSRVPIFGLHYLIVGDYQIRPRQLATSIAVTVSGRGLANVTRVQIVPCGVTSD